MSRRSDLFRSLFRAGADRAAERLGELGPVAAVRRIVREARNQQTEIDQKALTRAVAHLQGVSSASVNVRPDGIHIDASFDREEPLICKLTPVASRFAPRGAKELVFRVEPASALRHRELREVTGAIAGLIAHHLWAVVLARHTDSDFGGAIVDRDGSECLRVDLRTVPAVRAVAKQRTAAMVLEVLTLHDLTPTEGALEMKVKFPRVF